MPNWNVEDALDEVRDTLQQSTFLTVTSAIQTEVRDLLRPSFEAQHGSTGNWDRDKGRVLSMVALVSSFATALTLGDWANDIMQGENPPRPVEVREEDARAALYYVATMVCTSFSLLAGYCGNLSMPDPSESKLAALQSVVQASTEEP